jgi:hypothetical protein
MCNSKLRKFSDRTSEAMPKLNITDQVDKKVECALEPTKTKLDSGRILGNESFYSMTSSERNSCENSEHLADNEDIYAKVYLNNKNGCASSMDLSRSGSSLLRINSCDLIDMNDDSMTDKSSSNEEIEPTPPQPKARLVPLTSIESIRESICNFKRKFLKSNEGGSTFNLQNR